MSLQTNLERIYGMPIRDLLIDLYIKKDMNISELVEELQVSMGTIYNWLKLYNISKIRGEKNGLK